MLAAGGFRDAAESALHGAASAELQAISAAAAHRLTRGIWTRRVCHWSVFLDSCAAAICYARRGRPTVRQLLFARVHLYMYIQSCTG